MVQATELCRLQRNSMRSSSTHTVMVSKERLPLVAFANVGNSDAVSQLSFTIGSRAGRLQKASTFHLLLRSLYKLRRSVWSTAAAAILVTRKALDEVVLLKSTLGFIYKTDWLPAVLADTDILNNSLCSQQNMIERSVRGDVTATTLSFKTSVYCFCWIWSFAYSAALRTKPNSALADALCIALASVAMSFDVTPLKAALSGRLLGWCPFQKGGSTKIV